MVKLPPLGLKLFGEIKVVLNLDYDSQEKNKTGSSPGYYLLYFTLESYTYGSVSQEVALPVDYQL